MYLIIEQEKCEGGCLIIVYPDLEELFYGGRTAVARLPGGQNKEIGPNLRRKDAEWSIA